MESSIHTTLKPASIKSVVECDSGQIIALKVCSMPAKGHLAVKNREKYWPRKNERPSVRSQLLETLAKVAAAV